MHFMHCRIAVSLPAAEWCHYLKIDMPFYEKAMVAIF